MAEQTINGRIRQKYDFNVNYEANNGILLVGEVAYGKADSSKTYTTLKIGDGVSNYNTLPTYQLLEDVDVDEIHTKIDNADYTTTCTLLTGSWAKGSGSLYELSCEVPGLTEDSYPVVALVIEPSHSLSDTYADMAEYAKICGADTHNNNIVFYATAKPARSLNVLIKGRQLLIDRLLKIYYN